MNEKEYFRISERKKLPARCPILDYCVRRAYTLYFLGDYNKSGENQSVVKILQKYEVLKSDFDINEIALSGEVPSFMNGKNYKTYDNFCPEVNLFEIPAFQYSKGTASSSGEWDEFREKQFVNKKYRHYSECAEFSKNQYEKGVVKPKKVRNRRVPISQKLRFEIFQKNNFTCQYCGRNKDEDKIKLEIDHIIPIAEGGKDKYDNLITSCRDCNQGKSNKMI